MVKKCLLQASHIKLNTCFSKHTNVKTGHVQLVNFHFKATNDSIEVVVNTVEYSVISKKFQL